MHILDGMLIPQVILFGWASSLPPIAYSLSRLRSMSEEKAELMPILSALVFAAQMVNWGVPGGSTAHLVGSALLTIVLGVSGGAVSMATILVVQAFIFGDGGILTLGANILNMGVIGCGVAYLSYRALRKVNADLAAFLSAWLSVVTAALAAGVELGLSSPVFGFGLEVAVPVMGVWHALLGVPEGLVTMAAVRVLRRGGYVE